MSINVEITLADRFAAAKAAADAAAEALEALKSEVKALGQEKVYGITCDLSLSLYEQSRIDHKLLKALLTDEQIESCKKTVLCEKITVKAKGIK